MERMQIVRFSNSSIRIIRSFKRANRNVFQLMLDSIFFLSFVWASVAIAHFSIFVNPAICWQKLARCIPPDEYLWCTVHLSKQIFCSLSGNERPNALFSRDPFFFSHFCIAARSCFANVWQVPAWESIRLLVRAWQRARLSLLWVMQSKARVVYEFHLLATQVN